MYSITSFCPLKTVTEIIQLQKRRSNQTKDISNSSQTTLKHCL